ncbi:hypothetical protein GCM10025864_21780 [Luteimicrobium album]|uniref:Uncharacterized protein n=1 Tax=Luteimicrobium album TaxID=1054550 RepID=A0ABQ6I382_9MICO|nr:hypothetical protein [Luteimicrobium album]GMA24419.1 hypothetical protein GCM10025864_21780 [Luteimicrobium album]
MGLFGRRRATDPSSWRELWEALGPLGGRLTPEAVRRWEDIVATSPPAFIEAASEQLGHAYRLLGTEAHAREIGPGAFEGTGRPFAAERFGRVVDAVVVAGPDAVARVAADATAVRSYAAAVPLLDPVLAYRGDGDVTLGVELLRIRDRSRFERGAELRAPRSRRFVTSAADLDRDALRAWPSLRGRQPGQVWTGIRDPEEPWLEVDASDLDVVPGASDLGDVEATRAAQHARDAPGSWYGAGLAAAERLFTALGPDALGPDAATAGVALVSLELEHPADPKVDGPDLEPGQWAEMLSVPLVLDPTDAATTEGDARTGVLARACARRLLDLPLVATSQNLPTLKRLAGF